MRVLAADWSGVRKLYNRVAYQSQCLHRMQLMKFTAVFIASIMACGLLVTNIAHSAPSSFAVPPDIGRQTWFLDLLKTLADTHGLNNADKVGNILGVSFEKAVTNTSPSHDEAFAKSFERIDYTPNKPTWFQAGPIGYAYPRVSDGNSIYFKYYYLERHGLPTESLGSIEFDSAKDDTQSTIIFYGVSAFTCITLRDITSYFPNIHHKGKTDASPEAYMYYPAVGEEAGSVLSFAAIEGECLPEVEISEFSSFGKRYARAQYKFDRCLQDAAEEFRQDHGQFLKQDCWTPQEIEWHLRQKCVNFNHFYQDEPHSNEEPPPRLNFETPQSQASPCHYH